MEWVDISSSGGSSQPRDRTPVSYVSCIVRRVLYHCTTTEIPFFHFLRMSCLHGGCGDMAGLLRSRRSPTCVRAMSLQSCPTPCDPMDCNPPGSSVHGLLQARTLEWVAISFSRGSSQPRDWTPGLLNCKQTLYHLSHQGNP